MQELTDASWDHDVLRAPLPVVVVFWADWSIPSRTAKANLEGVETRWRGRLRAALVDADAQPALATACNVLGLPTLLVFVGGAEVERRVGLMSSEALHERLAPYAGRG